MALIKKADLKEYWAKKALAHRAGPATGIARKVLPFSRGASALPSQAADQAGTEAAVASPGEEKTPLR
jgi:hypothetical protein